MPKNPSRGVTQNLQDNMLKRLMKTNFMKSVGANKGLIALSATAGLSFYLAANALGSKKQDQGQY